jgi:hypothetical protein
MQELKIEKEIQFIYNLLALLLFLSNKPKFILQIIHKAPSLAELLQICSVFLRIIT